MILRQALARRKSPAFARNLTISKSPISWQQDERPQQTIASAVERSGVGLHSGVSATVRLIPARAGEGRYFVKAGDEVKIPASIDHVEESVLCTTLRRGSAKVSTVEHLMSALEGSGIDNVPILDGSSREWVEAIEEAGICSAKDDSGDEISRFSAVVHEPLYVWKNDSFVAAFPHPKTRVTCGIDFSQVSAIGCQWFSCFPTIQHTYSQEIAPSRTFCIFEEVDGLRNAGLIQGGSVDNAIVCSISSGWINPPLRFPDEPCRHKILDLVGDLSLLAENGNQGLPVAHLVAYKAGHALHARFASMLRDIMVKLKGEV
ncbi:putative UDP-3-O-acyl-N-acetylglucosamine deacetylase 1, mitochondrial isoform X2 [Wolffia australiana]